MNARELHESAIVFDGLIIAKWSREVFADMRRGGLTAAKELRITENMNT
jgi:membrane dipeptidase